jgi:hypothetical protein
VWKSLLAAALGAVAGFVLALLLFWSGPWIIGWIKGPPRLETEAWVFYVTVICGTGFGAVAGAVIGTAATLAVAPRSRGPSV